MLIKLKSILYTHKVKIDISIKSNCRCTNEKSYYKKALQYLSTLINEIRKRIPLKLKVLGKGKIRCGDMSESSKRDQGRN